jgi:hypothetical protein
MKAPKQPKAPTPPPAPPPPPTIDEAVSRSEESDKLRRRRGRLATIFAGQRGGAAPVQQKTLTGQ